MPRFIVEADGGSRGNPGPAGYGALVRDAETGIVLAERSESIGTATNNVAEYNGLIAGLRAAAEIDPRADIEVRMDSKLVMEQMSGRWKVKHPDMKPLAATAAEAARSFARITYTWVPREQNKDADRLANEAMDRATGRPPKSPASRLDPKPAPPDNSKKSAGDNSKKSSKPSIGWGAPKGQPTVTLLLRHGQTPLSAERRFAGIGDIELTETGIGQAKLAGERLAARGGVDVIVTSPLLRARQTAAEVAAATGAPVVADDDLRETDFGEWEGLTFAEAQQRWPDEVTAWLSDPEVAPPGGESFAAAGVRVRAGLARLLDQYAEDTVVVVSHVTPIKMLLTEALLAPPAAMYRMHLDVGALNEIHWFGDGPAVVRSLNDTGHLR
ncbi:MAG TPA: bifunctional RNase H/acid phosphatase [Streptosporangiaceae bacterium]|jgi:probable phosphoglycerate mutase|nr:bifunctional RNase H/acid phosphatase [Streptosporangiaceae bacterium]